MSKTKNWLMDMEEEFYAIANKEIGECEHISEFVAKMQHHEDKIAWTLDEGTSLEDLCGDMWSDYWAKYI
jgi:hypothetical protein